MPIPQQPRKHPQRTKSKQLPLSHLPPPQRSALDVNPPRSRIPQNASPHHRKRTSHRFLKHLKDRTPNKVDDSRPVVALQSGKYSWVCLLSASWSHAVVLPSVLALDIAPVVPVVEVASDAKYSSLVPNFVMKERRYPGNARNVL